MFNVFEHFHNSSTYSGFDKGTFIISSVASGPSITLTISLQAGKISCSLIEHGLLFCDIFQKGGLFYYSVRHLPFEDLRQ
jgi:hypothetical protein